MADRVALFVRAPIQGRVKTRLAAAIGPQAALAAHRRLTLHALRQLSGREDYSLEIWCSQAHEEVLRWGQEFQLPVFVQQGADLGERMAHCLETLCRDSGRAGDKGRGAIVGCDCPSVDGDYLADAFAALDTADLVLGPAEDGGYGLIAWGKAEAPAVFTSVSWGSSQVLAQSLDYAAQAGLQTRLLPTIWDVDNIADWRRFERDF